MVPWGWGLAAVASSAVVGAGAGDPGDGRGGGTGAAVRRGPTAGIATGLGLVSVRRIPAVRTGTRRGIGVGALSSGRTGTVGRPGEGATIPTSVALRSLAGADAELVA
jgi:hypothetical protein